MSLTGTGARAPTTAELQTSRDAAVQYMRQNRGTNTILRSVWGSGLVDAQRTLGQSSISAPAGLTPELAAAYRTSMLYQIARGRETGNQLVIDVARARLEILDRMGF